MELWVLGLMDKRGALVTHGLLRAWQSTLALRPSQQVAGGLVFVYKDRRSQV